MSRVNEKRIRSNSRHDRTRLCAPVICHKKMRELQCEFLAGEVRDQLEHVEPYGFTSEPLADGKPEAFALFFDGNRSNGIVFCVADRRYRITNMKAGEVAIYDDQGQQVYFMRDQLLISTPKN